ncbi:MAG: TraB/GumN family protein [Pseudomonadota bacterium]|nr:TraB/GumN family protein [Pseudomonadota bacterium]HJO35932.1 TraB/GumN family protein [Gammaproteobacteria bacterium]
MTAEEPSRRVRVGDTDVDLLGTAHISHASARAVAERIATGEYDAVAIELCPSRHQALIDPDSLARLDLMQVLRDGRAGMVAASLALGAYQRRLAAQLGIEPGAEMRAAAEAAEARDLPLWLVDREIGVTMRRLYRSVPWWQRPVVISGLLASLLSREQIEEADIERLKAGDVLHNTFAEFAAEAAPLHRVLIAERDRYMAARLREHIAAERPRRVLVVIGAGHLAGLAQALAEDAAPPGEVAAELASLPPASRWPRLVPYLIVALVLAGFAIGFARSPELGLSLVGDWVLINGGLSAAGALLALAHPLTIAGAFVAAPLTSLNPTIGAGFVAAALEIWLRKPQVADFQSLRDDVMAWRGWWRNRVSRVLLVFFLVTLGSAAGTYIAGFRIFDQLVG